VQRAASAAESQSEYDDPMPPVPARLTVARDLPTDVRQRQIYVSLDGQPWATLVFGESATREITPGPHAVRAHNTLVWKTLRFDAQPGEEVTFDVANRPGRGFMSAMALLGVGPLFLTFERRRADAGVSGGNPVTSA
jgi:hypothetical protein